MKIHWLISVSAAVLLGACASAPRVAVTAQDGPVEARVESDTARGGIPRTLQPNRGKTAARAAGFGAAADFVK